MYFLKENKNYLFYLIFNFCILSSFSQSDEIKLLCKTLCSKEHFGRGYVKNGDSISSEFIANEFKKRNLFPINSNYFQEYYFDVNTFPTEMLVKINDRILIPGVDYIVDPASNSVKKQWNFYLINTDTLLQLDTNIILKKIKEKNKSDLIIDLKNIRSEKLKLIKNKAKELSNFVDVILLVDEKLTYSVSTTILKKSLICIKDFIINENDKVETNILSKFITNHRARNVISILSAKNKSDKYIVISAHYDHLGGMGGDVYFPGANDNASGVSIMFSIAEKLSKFNLKKNIIFIAFSGEEAGLLGSYYFVKNPVVPLKNIDFVLNLDIMGSGEDGITVVNATEFPKRFNQLEKINNKYKYLVQVKKRGKAANSDHYWFSENKVPSFFIYTMGTNKNYHDINDTYENLSFFEFNDLTELIIKFIRKV